MTASRSSLARSCLGLAEAFPKPSGGWWDAIRLRRSSDTCRARGSPSNLYLEPGAFSAEDVLRTAGRGVYVQDVTGLHSGASSVTGDFSVGAEGLPVVDGENIALADAAECMAERAAALLSDAAQATRLGAAGRRVVEEHFSWKMVADSLLGAYEETARRPGLWSVARTRVSQAGRAG